MRTRSYCELLVFFIDKSSCVKYIRTINALGEEGVGIQYLGFENELLIKLGKSKLVMNSYISEL